MSDNPFQQSYRPPEDQYSYGGPRCGPRHGVMRTALTWAAVAVIAMLAFGLVASAFGFLFGLAVLLIKIAVVTAVIAFVWRRISRRHHRNYDL
jgi:hypothetical protein